VSDREPTLETDFQPWNSLCWNGCIADHAQMSFSIARKLLNFPLRTVAIMIVEGFPACQSINWRFQVALLLTLKSMLLL